MIDGGEEINDNNNYHDLRNFITMGDDQQAQTKNQQIKTGE